MTVASNSLDGPDSEATRALQIIESMPGHAWSADAAGRFTYVSPNTLAFLGNAREDLNVIEDEDEFGWRRVVHPDDYDRVVARWRHCLETGDHYDTEHRLRRADGVYRWFRNSGRPSRDSQGRIIQWYGTTIDIEDQKQVETALRDRERELSQLVDMVPSHLWRLTPDGEPIFFNKRMVDFLGLDVADTDKPGMSRLEAVIETIHPDDAAKFRDALSRCLVTGERFSMRYRLRRADGIYRWMSSRAEPLRDQHGGIVQWYGLCHDIDDQVTAEEALRQSERSLQQVIDTVPVLIFLATPAGDPIYANKRLADFHGFQQEEFDVPGETRMDRSVRVLVHPDDRPAVHQALKQSFLTGEPFAMRYRQRRHDGVYRWIEGRAEPLRDDDGEIVRWYGVNLDVDDEVRAQDALRDRERELSQLVDMVPSYLWRLSPDGEPTFFNKRLIDFFGLDIADTDKPDTSRLAAIIETFAHPDDAAGLAVALNHSIVTGQRFSLRYRLRRADGVYRWLDGSAEPMRDESGRIVQWYGLSHDIDDQVKAEEALRRSERQLRQLIDTVPVQIWCATPAGEPAYINKAMVDYIGLKLEDFDAQGGLPSAIQTIVHPDDRAVLLRALTHSYSTGEPFELRFRNRRWDGSYRWTEGRADPLRDETGRIMRWYGVNVDIHDLVSSQKALERSERQLQQMIDAVPVNMLSFSPSGKVTYVSKRYLDHLGVPEGHFEDFHGLAQELVHPEDAPETLRAASSGFAAGRAFAIRYRRREKDAYRWIESRAEPLRDPGGVVVQWYVVSIDIDDEKRAQEALGESERSFCQLVETLPALIYCATPDGTPIYRSQKLREFLGFNLEDKDEAGRPRLASTLDAIIHPDDLAVVKERYGQSLLTGEPYALKHRLRRSDGEYRWVETRTAAMRNADGEIVQWNGVCLDIEDQVRAQEGLRLAQESLARASQAASLAELSASIAHEVNQPLAAVVANSHACQRWLTAEPPNIERAQKTVERITRDANAAADVVSRIRALFKHSVGPRNFTTLGAIVLEARDLTAEEATRRSVRMDVEVESDLPLVAFDRVQIQQVLINLIRNGMEAMDSVTSDRVLRIRVRRIGDVVQAEITDRGRGVELPDRIFEPFFTTKQHGMGMGLAICRSIVESHGGRLWAEKNEPHGATFIFTLPVEAKSTP